MACGRHVPCSEWICNPRCLPYKMIYLKNKNLNIFLRMVTISIALLKQISRINNNMFFHALSYLGLHSHSLHGACPLCELFIITFDGCLHLQD